ncbi:MAG: CofH family radical SAM protein [Acidobacteriota bacterium]|jgi:cyclic dehypoxanthinyl futalosine synthase|nr:CofH family radical SAM protein [Acidobacteriota bacterium]
MATVLRPEPTGEIGEILEKAVAGRRLTPQEALAVYRDADFLQVMATARAVRNRMNDPAVVTYTLFRIVNYTNVCAADCSFCSFHCLPGDAAARTLTLEEILDKMREAVALGARQLFLQGGVNPAIPFDYYLQILRAVKKEFGSDVHIRAFSPSEIGGMELRTGKSARELIRALKDAGMDSVPGAGAEILSDRVRGVLSPKKVSVAQWVRIMETCLEEGLPGSANIVIGSVETPEEIVEHLRIIRDLQDRTRGLLAFIPWTFQRQTEKFPVRHVPTREYLKLLGLCRLFLDNIPHIEASVLGMGRGVGELALYAGADDISSVVIEENVLESHGLGTEAEARDFIRASGFEPARRDLLYK